MKVKYIDKRESLTIEKEYIVLEILNSVGKGLLYRLVGDNKNKMPALYSGSQFKIISEVVPTNWSINIINKSLIVLGPKIWRENEFWDACYEHDLKALEIYKREARIIYDEEDS